VLYYYQLHHHELNNFQLFIMSFKKEKTVPTKTIVKNISGKREEYEEEETKRKNKEKLKQLEKRKKEVEEEILKEVERLARGKIDLP